METLKEILFELKQINNKLDVIISNSNNPKTYEEFKNNIKTNPLDLTNCDIIQSNRLKLKQLR